MCRKAQESGSDSFVPQGGASVSGPCGAASCSGRGKGCFAALKFPQARNEISAPAEVNFCACENLFLRLRKFQPPEAPLENGFVAPDFRLQTDMKINHKNYTANET